MNAHKLSQQSSYFQSGYYEGSNGWRSNPTGYDKAQKGSYAYCEYEDGHKAGKEDSGN